MNNNKEYLKRIENKIDNLRKPHSIEDLTQDDITQAIANAISVPILKMVRDQSLARQLFSVEPLDQGAQSEYPMGRLSQRKVFYWSRINN